MRNILLPLVFVLLAALPRAQEQIPLGLHVLADGSIAAVVFDRDIGEVRIASRATQGPAAPPTISSSWTDEDGVDHVVTTPIVGAGETGMLKAMEHHRQLVLLMQRHYPPKP